MQGSSALEPSKTQEHRIRELEEASFKRFCLARGLPESEVVGEWVACAQQELDWSLGQLPGHDSLQEEIAEIATLEHWRNHKLRQLEWSRRLAAQDIVAVADALPIDWAHVSKIAISNGVKAPRKGDLVALREFVESIPYVLDLSPSIDGAVWFEDPADVPVVIVHESVVAACTTILNYGLDIILDAFECGRSHRSTLEMCSSVCHDFSAIRDALSRALSWSLGCGGELLEMDSRFLVTSNRPSASWVRFFASGARFCRLHEYGHILQGHKGGTHDIDQELAADRFAFDVMSASEPIERAHVGIAGLFAILTLREAAISQHAEDRPLLALQRARALLGSHRCQRTGMAVYVALLSVYGRALADLFAVTRFVDVDFLVEVFADSA